MLKTNTLKARENVKNYITENFNEEYNNGVIPGNFGEVAEIIYKTFYAEVGKFRTRQVGEQNAFYDWCAGLCGILDTCYFYNRSAVEDLGGILEETEEEKARYTEDKAEKLLTNLIYREIKREVLYA